ncbi:hypothetical protein L3Y34_010534 [Caenorhabditis briggsae]|uniref:Uncharacterized protein n=1 Tax=Caenorhabditis briggsae TaxID=6238 RepID=A0AAE8ZLQ4_CAEBR|nr:hypothetical protein L3Y34_010534 [Caenorhabditis briggsae]
MGKGYKKSYPAPQPPNSGRPPPPNIAFDPSRPPPPLNQNPSYDQRPGLLGPPYYDQTVMIPHPLPPMPPGLQPSYQQHQQHQQQYYQDPIVMVAHPLPPGYQWSYQQLQPDPSTMVHYPMPQLGQMPSGYQQVQDPTTIMPHSMPVSGHLLDHQGQDSSTMMPHPMPYHHHQPPQNHQQTQQDSLPPPQKSTVRTVQTELGPTSYRQIVGNEYEVLFPGKKGTERVFKENPEETIRELAARIRKGPTGKLEKIERRIEHLVKEVAALKLNCVRQPEPEKLSQVCQCVADTKVMEPEPSSTLPQIEEVVEAGSLILRSEAVPEIENEDEHVKDKEQLEPATSNSSPETISNAVGNSPTAEEIRQKKAAEKKARIDAEQKRILEKKLEKERFKKHEKEKKKREEEERKMKKEAERIRKQKENEEKTAKERARREQEEKEMKEKDKQQRKKLHDQKRAKRVQKKMRKEQKEAEKIAEQTAENAMWEDICQESAEYNFHAAITSRALSDTEIELVLNDKFPEGFNVERIETKPNFVKKNGNEIRFEGAEGEDEATDNGAAGSSGEHSQMDGDEGSTKETPILVSSRRRSSQSTIFETISEADELAEEVEIQEELRREELRRSRKRFSSTTYDLSDFEEPAEEADVQQDGEVDESREGESEDPAPEVTPEASWPKLELIPAEQVDDDTYAVYDENGVQYFEVIGEEAEDEEDEADEEVED